MLKIRNLWPLWVEENLHKETVLRDKIHNAYNSLKNKDSYYANSIKNLLDIRETIVKLWVKAKHNLKEKE